MEILQHPIFSECAEGAGGQTVAIDVVASFHPVRNFVLFGLAFGVSIQELQVHSPPFDRDRSLGKGRHENVYQAPAYVASAFKMAVRLASR